MNENDITKRFPNASRSFIAANLSPVHQGQIAKLESDIGTPPLGQKQAQEAGGGRFLVRVVSIRKRLLDEDNLCEKFHVDLCRYAGVIPSDAPDKTKIEVSQRKAKKGEEESIEIDVYEIL